MEPSLTSMLMRALSEPGLMKRLSSTHGSPLHVVFPQQAFHNAQHWQDVLKSTYERIDIRFGMKACKSNLLTQAYARAGIGADASSAEEIAAAMRSLIPTHRISVTGPHKPDHEIALCLAHKLNLHLDSPEEFQRLLQLSRQMAQECPLTFRLKPHSSGKSRFGFTFAQLLETVRSARMAGIHSGGVSFHINDYTIESRISAFRECCDLVRTCAEIGFQITSIDFGGGYPIRYTQNFDEDLYKQGSHWLEQRGQLYPYGSQLTAADHAKAIIEAIDRPTLSYLASKNVTLMFQPGRSLLDQCGISLFRVLGTKPCLESDAQICTLNGTSFSLSETWFNADFAPAPVLINDMGFHQSTGGDYSYFLMGRSCLEGDVVRSRVVQAAYPLRSGDLVCFINTAGYQMDSNESPFHRLPLPIKIGLLEGTDGFTALDDEKNTFLEFNQ